MGGKSPNSFAGHGMMCPYEEKSLANRGIAKMGNEAKHGCRA
jgi:hypothetical protein